MELVYVLVALMVLYALSIAPAPLKAAVFSLLLVFIVFMAAMEMMGYGYNGLASPKLW